MELDLRYQQYNFGNSVAPKQDDAQKQGQEAGQNRPYQEIINYFEQYKNAFNYAEFKKIIYNVTQELELALDDGTKVKIVPMEKLVHVALKFPDGNKFIGTLTNITDEKEFDKAMAE